MAYKVISNRVNAACVGNEYSRPYPTLCVDMLRFGLVIDYDRSDDICSLRLNGLHRVSVFNFLGIALKAFLTL